jgi:hypothetical protein
LTYLVVHAKLMGMYLRTTQRKNRDSGEVVYYQLAHNVRHPKTGSTVAHVIHTFGRAAQLKREGLVRLCRSSGRGCGLAVGEGGSEGVSELPRAAERRCLAEDVRLVGSHRLGLVWVVEALWERLAVGPTWREVMGGGGGARTGAFGNDGQPPVCSAIQAWGGGALARDGLPSRQ